MTAVRDLDMTWDEGWEYAEEHGQALARWIEERGTPAPDRFAPAAPWGVVEDCPLLDPEES